MQQRSALDSWSRMSEESWSPQPAIARYMPLVFSAVGAVGIAPFAAVRWWAGDWPIAIIDTVLVLGFILLGVYVYRARNVRVAGLLIAALCVLGTLTAMELRGAQQVYWAYPTLMTCFYLLGSRDALMLTTAMTAVIYVQLAEEVEAFRLAAIIVTIVITAAFAFFFSILNSQQQNQLLRLATRDPLTGVGNRRAFVSKLAEVVAKFERTRQSSALIMLDVDHFKQINDLHGHSAGDEVLRRFAHRIESRIRLTDKLYRLGGEEFIVVIDGQGVDAAASLAEDLRQRIESTDIVPGIAVTVSVGVAEIRQQETHEGWLRRADAAMYRAKRAGRNRVQVSI